MKKIISIVLISASLVTAYHAPTRANADLTSNLQIEQLFHQARLLAGHGASQEDILNIFEQNLAQEILSASKPNASQRLLLASIICIACVGIGAGATYYFMNNKITEKDAEITQLNAHEQRQAALIQQLQAEIVNLNQGPAQQPQQQNPPQQRGIPQNMNLGNLLQQVADNAVQHEQPPLAAEPPQNIDDFLQQLQANRANPRSQNPDIARIMQELEQVGGNPFAGVPI